ncbi:hypothetical protein HKD37_15G042882 [Glycine soja]
MMTVTSERSFARHRGANLPLPLRLCRHCGRPPKCDLQLVAISQKRRGERNPYSLKMALPPQNPPVRRHKVINRHGEKFDTNLILNLAVALENAKISSFRFDFSGNGESEGSDVVLLFASKYSDIKTIVNLSEHYDMKAGIGEPFGKDYLERIRKDGFIDVKKRRSANGFNFGVSDKLFYRLDGYHGYCGSFDFHVTEESLMDRLGINMHEACLQIDKECRVFTIHGSSDEIIPVEDAFEFAKIISNHKLHVIEGANHIFSNHQGDLSSVVVNCIEETLHQVKGTAS